MFNVRIENYEMYEKLFESNHKEAFFNRRVSEQMEKYGFMSIPWPSTIAYKFADLLFEEFPLITTKGNNDFIENLFTKNELKIQLYESAVENSFRGDVVLKLRVEENEVFLEDVNPAFYFPIINENNTREKPKIHIFKQKFTTKENENFLFIEEHRPGLVLNYVTDIEEKNVYDVREFFPTKEPETETRVSEPLVVHIPNIRINSSFWGISDYRDLMDLFFELDNRMTVVKKILFKHSDPQLSVPQGILDEEGRMRNPNESPQSRNVRAAQAVASAKIIEQGDKGEKPEYITWDGKLDSSFSELDKITQELYKASSLTPALFGEEKGGNVESGRSLKYKILNTLSKKHRKQNYYDVGIKKILYLAQELSYRNGYTCNGVKSLAPENIVIKWEDGILNDMLQTIETETKKLDSKLTTRKEAIMVIDNVTEKEAEEKIKQIDEEKTKEEEAEKTKLRNDLFGTSYGKEEN